MAAYEAAYRTYYPFLWLMLGVVIACCLVWITIMLIRSASWPRMLFFKRLSQNLFALGLLAMIVSIIGTYQYRLLTHGQIWLGVTALSFASAPAGFWLLMNRSFRESAGGKGDVGYGSVARAPRRL